VAPIPPQLAELERLRGTRVLVYAALIGDDSIPVLYEYLRSHGRAQRLDFVLSTVGGDPAAARRLALLLRDYTENLTVLVPHRARSAGTLLCLGADKLVLGPMAELGPLDAQIGSAGQPPPDAPGMISVQDIRVFRQMAEEWFGVNREEDRLQVLALLAQRVFPASLSAFYRFDRMVRQIAEELLDYQLPDATREARQRIIDQLVGGYHAHDYVLSRADACKLGLRVHFPTVEEEGLLWGLMQACRTQIAEHPGQTEGETTGLIAATDFHAQEVHRWVAAPSWRDDEPRDEAASRPERQLDTRWQIGM
jgi:hypothetical protein